MKLIHYALVLGLICIASALGVSGTFKLTKQPIEAKLEQGRNDALKTAMNVGKESPLDFEIVAGSETAAPEDDVYKALDAQGAIVGYAAMGQAQGYGGKVRVMVGMDADAAKIVAVTIVEQSETPGLGTQVAEVKSNKTWIVKLTGRKPKGSEETTSVFLKQFPDRTPEQVRLGADAVQAISGATVSSTAVVNAARDAVARIHDALPGVGPATDPDDPHTTKMPPTDTDATTGATQWQR